MIKPRIEGTAYALSLIGLLGACAAPEAAEPAAPASAGAAAISGKPAAPGATGGTNNSAAPSTAAQTQVHTATPTAASPQSPDAVPAGSPNAAAIAAGNAAGTSNVPCAVSKLLAKNCQTCHGSSPIGGAPMPLVTFADLHAPAKTQPTMKVYELSKVRLHDASRPMPPTGRMPTEEVAALDAWFDGGALAAGAQEAACDATAGEPTTAPGTKDGSIGRLQPGPGETCYEFKVHQSTTAVDEEPFAIPVGEQYEQFYYKVPWPADTVAVSYATVPDNAAVLHHWLLFATNEVQAEGAHITAPLPTLIGTDPQLLTGWAVGGPNLEMPKDVGMELPNPGRTINVQWHFYNSGADTAHDRSTVQICTVPKAMRANVGAVTFLGTEDLNGNVWSGGPGMPANKESTFTTTCRPGRGDIPIHIVGFESHMHRIGKRMTTAINRKDGTKELVFDEPFNFGNERHYFSPHDVMPGETLETSCTFLNDNNFGVPFGESTDSEMCYQFAFHYPAHALTNGAFSLLGVSDTCW